METCDFQSPKIILLFILVSLSCIGAQAQVLRGSVQTRSTFKSCTTPPIITCPNDFRACPGVSVEPSNAGYATALPGDIGCNQPVVSYMDQIFSVGPCTGAIEINRTWTATDPQNTQLKSSCRQRIVLKDDTPPVLTQCPADITVQVNAACKANVSWSAPSVSDNCGRLFLSTTHISGDVFSIGTTQVKYTAEDLCGNTASCTFNVTVVGDCCKQAPVLSCPKDYLGCPSDTSAPKKTGQASARGATADCGIPVVRFSDQLISRGPCPNAVHILRTWTATDPIDTNLQSRCTQIIQLRDEEKPQFLTCPQNITAVPGRDCKAQVHWNPPVVTDNCGMTQLNANFQPGASFGPGQYTVIYTAVDQCQNSSSCSFNVVVEACCNVPPAIRCPVNYTGCPGSSVEPSITGMAVAAPGAPSCQMPLISYRDILIKEGPCAGAKLIERVWTATDSSDSNLKSSCTQYVELKDNTVPSFTSCPPNLVLTAGPNCEAVANWIAPTGMDNCSQVRIVGSHAPGSSFKLGVTTVTYTIVDDCGNAGTHTFTVTVTGNCCNKPPVIHCPPNYAGCPTPDYGPHKTGHATATAESGCGNPLLSYSDSVLLVYSKCPHARLVKRTWRATSAIDSKLYSECVQYIDLKDNTPPAFTSCPPHLTVYAHGACDAQVFWNPPTAMDNCDQHVAITSNYKPGDRFPSGTTRVVYTATDACGNRSTHAFDVTVVGAGIKLTCPSDIHVNKDPFYNGAIVNWKHPQVKLCGKCVDSLPGFVYMGEFNGHRYFCSRKSENWHTAKRICESNGGYLAVMNSPEENAYVASKLMGATAWIGLTDERIEGYFEWVDGSPLSFVSWYPGQPNNQNGDQDHVELMPDGKWNDQFGHALREYVCEIPCYTIKQIAGPPCGSLFPCGTTKVVYVAEQGSARDTCSFNVTVHCPKEPPYCAARGLDCRYMWIDCVELSNVNNCSGHNGGYAYFDRPCINLQANSSYRLCLRPGYSNNQYQVYWKVWIDYNADYDFDDPGELVAYGTGVGRLCGTIQIPNCITANTRMRVIMSYGGYVPNPCCTFTYGEVEDYCVSLQARTFNGGNHHLSKHPSPVDMSSTGTRHQDLNTEWTAANDVFYDEAALHIYPNPATENVYILMDGIPITMVEMFDTKGKKCLQWENADDHRGLLKLDVNHMQPGVYWIVVHTQNNKIYKRGIIIKS